METQVVALLTTRPLLTVPEAAAQLGTSVEAMGPIFAAIAAAHDSAYTLLSSVIEEAAGGQSTSVAMRKAVSITGDASAYALLAAAYPAHAAASSLPVHLRPAAAPSVRAYPVVSRAAMESRPLQPAPAPVTPAPVKSASIEVAGEVQSPAATAPALPATVAAPLFAAPPPPPPQPLPPASPTTAAAAPSPPPSAPSTPKEGEKAHAPAAAPTPTPASPAPAPVTASPPAPVAAPQPTIFDKMKAAAASKRVREEGGAAVAAAANAGATAKPARAPGRPKKAAKTETTTSLAKLARASKKKAGSGAAATSAAAAVSQSFLDDDDEGEATNRFSQSEDRSSHAEPSVQEEAPVFDVVEVSASNDDVIMCDDAPPLAFRPAVPVQAPPAAKKEAAAKKGGAGSAGESGGAQSTLGAFFSAAVVEFQKTYVREVQTEMRVEDGEFVCCDVPCYKHKATGELISEDEYHRRTAALARSSSGGGEAGDGTPNQKGAGTAPVSPPSPAAAQKTSARSGAAKSDGRDKAAAPPAKTLLSFFKPASAS